VGRDGYYQTGVVANGRTATVVGQSGHTFEIRPPGNKHGGGMSGTIVVTGG
jgi:hypothetical protein